MIFPFFRRILGPSFAPATWALLAINLFVFFGTYDASVSFERKLDRILDDEAFLTTQGAAFSQFVEKQPGSHSRLLSYLAERSLRGDPQIRRLMGSLSLRNLVFLEHAETFPFNGDEVMLARWRVDFRELKDAFIAAPSTQWGLSDHNVGISKWVTYQFAHSGVEHLFWNMIFLLIFGCWLESLGGWSLVILTYLASGLGGAAAFMFMDGFSSKPVVGASGAVSGLIAMVAVLLWKKQVKFFYWWLLPGRDYFGIVMLPAWWLLVMFTFPDIGGYLGTIPEFSGVAHSAHIGGALAGILMGIAVHIGLLNRFPAEHLSDVTSDEKSTGTFG